MGDEINVRLDESTGEYRGRCAVHMDAFCWVKRDSYLPQGSHGLKAVTKYKLGYDPVEVDPENMVDFAHARPDHMAAYSVSDAVATYYLYLKYVHLFVFSLATIIPMGSEDVLRKGSGTLCEMLLMVEATRSEVVCPNKQNEPPLKFHGDHVLESETYIGGHVECLESGVFRADLPAKFQFQPSAVQSLIDKIDKSLTFAIEVEGGAQRGDVENYDEVRSDIVQRLERLRDQPMRVEEPVIYHLDVAAMYPNIILTNRLQPSAIVSATFVAALAAAVWGTLPARPRPRALELNPILPHTATARPACTTARRISASDACLGSGAASTTRRRWPSTAPSARSSSMSGCVRAAVAALRGWMRVSHLTRVRGSTFLDSSATVPSTSCRPRSRPSS